MLVIPVIGAFTVVNLIPALIALAIFLVPAVKILQRAGHSGWWVLLLFVPVADVIGLWVFAFARWPALDRGRET